MLRIFPRTRVTEGRRLRDHLEGSLFAKMAAVLIPSVVLVLIFTGYVTFRYHVDFIHDDMERTARLQVADLAHDTEAFLANCARDLRFIARTIPDESALRDILAHLLATSAIHYRELSFISQKTGGHRVFFAHGHEILQAGTSHLDHVVPDPLSFYDRLNRLAPDQVWISDVHRIEYPLFSRDHPNQKFVARVIYFGTPLAELPSGAGGYLLLAVDARDLRNLLSDHRAAAAAVWPYTQGIGKGGSYFLDTRGWILFEAEDHRQPEAELSTDVSRSGLTGTLGNENLISAFRPDPEYKGYWDMVGNIVKGRSGIVWLDGRRPSETIPGDRWVAYTPVRFRETPEGMPVIFGGVVISERTRLTEDALFQQVDILFMVILAAVALFLVLIFMVARSITRPIRSLAAALDHTREDAATPTIASGSRSREIMNLEASINRMIADRTREEARSKTEEKAKAESAIRDRTPADVDELNHQLAAVAHNDLPEIIGIGPKVERLKQEIRKAAHTEADVLIIGETGTGKQLAAEAIHRNSRRVSQPFVAINCGELDENLLLDTLFGHVKGAFTEAKTSRKGAFAEADGGILFLDEIQTASPRVQQALLRATAQRTIKPLGSDRESRIDVRLMAATNVDLSRLVEQGQFRQDLYYRLKVVTLTTPALREQPESIPVLAWHYFLIARAAANKAHIAITRGALEKMKRYHWPGNVRELINCITRAVVMAEGQQVHAGDILLDGEEGAGLETPADASAEHQSVCLDPIDETEAMSAVLCKGLNPRQSRIFPWIVRQGSVSRSEYQAFWKDGISSRTALYDLQDLVDKGLLRKSGRGPSTRYNACGPLRPV